jgi:hypothetical protein
MLHRRQIQIIRETSFRKKPSNRRTNPPRNSLGIHDLLLPLATRETHSAINHKNKASLRITIADYTAGRVCFSDRAIFRSADHRSFPLLFSASPRLGGEVWVCLSRFPAMTCDVGDSGDLPGVARHPSPLLYPSQIGAELSVVIPRSSQIGVYLASAGTYWRGLGQVLRLFLGLAKN